MGYSTKFEGVLEFKIPLRLEQHLKLEKILGEDVREHPEWNVPENLWMTYIDLETTKDLSGLKWTGDEKTYGMEHAIALVIRLMKEDFPEFGLSGSMFAQGEEAGDVYYIHVKKDVVTVQPIIFGVDDE